MTGAAPYRWPGIRWLGILAACAVIFVLPAGLASQQVPLLDLEIRGSDGGVDVRLGDLLADGGLARSLDAGLPLRFHLVTELWRDGWIDSQVGRHEWRATVRFDPIGRIYTVEMGDGLILHAGTPSEAAALLSSEVVVPIRPSARARYYYLARLEVETLALSDLDELRRWLRGEFAPAIGQESDVGGAFGRGLRRLLVRVLGLPAQRLQARTPAFAWEG